MAAPARTEARVHDEGVRLPADTDRVPYVDQIPTVVETAGRLRPYLRLWVNQGCPGLSARDRDDLTNLRADLEAGFERMVR